MWVTQPEHTKGARTKSSCPKSLQLEVGAPIRLVFYFVVYYPQECPFYGVLVRLFLVNEFYGLDKN